MGWVVALALAAAMLAGLIALARPRRGAIGLVAAMLLLGVAGYAWQGSPRLAGRPTPPRASHPANDDVFAAERGAWFGTVGPDAQLLDSADALIRNGDPGYAIGVLRAGIARAPGDMILWTGLGNALVTYADGAVTPAARYAFMRASALGRDNPAPAYFLALALAQSGDLDAAEKIWRAILAHAPADAPWRARVAEKLILLAAVRAGG